MKRQLQNEQTPLEQNKHSIYLKISLIYHKKQQ